MKGTQQFQHYKPKNAIRVLLKTHSFSNYTKEVVSEWSGGIRVGWNCRFCYMFVGQGLVVRVCHKIQETKILK